MFLKHLHLQTFRNFREQSFEFGPSFNVLVGDNAQGKTNVIEAIAFLSHGSSFRTGEWRDLIENGRGNAKIDAKTISSKGDDELRVVLQEPRKKFFKNGKSTTPGGFDGAHVVIFAPEEILLIRTQPAARRKFIDSFISSLKPTHKKLMRDYNSVVSHRNNILKEEELSRDEKGKRLAPWDDQLVNLGSRVMLDRCKWLSKLNELLPVHYDEIASGDGKAQLRYQPKIDVDVLTEGPSETAKALEEKLSERREDELRRQTTLVGPHRDDLVAYIGNDEVKRFSSQGQHRSFVLSLKIAESDVYRKYTGEQPILLLDDVASELDPGRNKRFFEYVQSSDGQVFITTTSMSDVKLTKKINMQSFVIEKGEARSECSK